jgi:Spy/CpxP family protein refolding chaperone
MMFGHGLMLGGLNLTQDQKDQVKKVIDANRPQMRSVFKENAEARLALHQAIVNGADQATISNLFQGVSKAEWDGVVLKQTLWTSIKPILTAEQLNQLQQNMNQRRQDLQNRLDKKTAGH